MSTIRWNDDFTAVDPLLCNTAAVRGMFQDAIIERWKAVAYQTPDDRRADDQPSDHADQHGSLQLGSRPS